MRVFGHLKLLADAGVDCRLLKVVLPEYVDNTADHGWTDADSEVARGMYHDVHRVRLGSRGKPGSKLARILRAAHDPAAFALGDILHRDGLRALSERIEEAEPDLIWAENLYSASLAHRLGLIQPVVFSHHDWYWRVREFYPGQSGLQSHAIRSCYRRHETRLVRETSGVISGSNPELQTIRDLGAKCSEYIPTAYPLAEITEHDEDSPPQIVHLGALSHWVNRISMHRFLDDVWPEIARDASPQPTLRAIGHRGDADLHAKLDAAGAQCPGIVPQLGDALRPYDIHVIPWEHNTGTRTRATAAMNHGQVIVALRAGVACLEELESGVNCVVVDRVEEMAPAILDLLRHPDTRRTLGDAARQTFHDCYSFDALQPRFRRFLAAVTGRDEFMSKALEPLEV